MTPEVSFVLLSYNQQDSVVDAAQAALNQDFPNLEVIISDDCSSDGSFERLSRVCEQYDGPHKLKLVSTTFNRGIVGNLAHALSIASGDLAIIAAADDLSRPTRASDLTRSWIDVGMPKYAVVYSDVKPVDGRGQLVQDWPEQVMRPPWTLERLAEGAVGPLGASCAITPNLIHEPQEIDRAVRHEDRVFPFRAVLMGGPVLFVDKALVDYRVSGGISRKAALSRRHYLTDFMTDYMGRLLPDARQRLTDAQSAGAPAHIVRRCRQVLTEQEALLAMSDGRGLLGKALGAVVAGARPSVIGTHLLRFLRAYAGDR